jgi:hypothetical protein
MAPALDPKLALKVGMKFIREHKGVTHTLETIASEDGSRFLLRDGKGVEHKSLSTAAKAATGWANANGRFFWRLAGANGATPKVKATRKPKAGVADTATMVAVDEVAVVAGPEPTGNASRPRRMADSKATPAKRGRTTGKGKGKRQQRDTN